MNALSAVLYGRSGEGCAPRCVQGERGCADPGEPKGEPERKESSKEGEIYTESKEKEDERKREKNTILYEYTTIHSACYFLYRLILVTGSTAVFDTTEKFE